jgi:hypothetical protein
MESSKAVKEYKEELIKSQEQNERLTTLESAPKCFHFAAAQELI